MKNFKFAEAENKVTYFLYIFLIPKMLSIWLFYFPSDLGTLMPSNAQGRIFTWCYNGKPGRFNTLLQCLPQLDLISVVIGHISGSLDHQTLLNSHCSQSYPGQYYCRMI